MIIKKYFMQKTIANKVLYISMVMAVVMLGSTVAEAVVWDNTTKKTVNKTFELFQDKKNQLSILKQLTLLKNIKTIPVEYKDEVLELLPDVNDRLSKRIVTGNQLGLLKRRFHTWLDEMLLLAKNGNGAIAQDAGSNTAQATASSLQLKESEVLSEDEQLRIALEESRISFEENSRTTQQGNVETGDGSIVGLGQRGSVTKDCPAGEFFDSTRDNMEQSTVQIFNQLPSAHTLKNISGLSTKQGDCYIQSALYYLSMNPESVAFFRELTLTPSDTSNKTEAIRLLRQLIIDASECKNIKSNYNRFYPLLSKLPEITRFLGIEKIGQQGDVREFICYFAKLIKEQCGIEEEMLLGLSRGRYNVIKFSDRPEANREKIQFSSMVFRDDIDTMEKSLCSGSKMEPVSYEGGSFRRTLHWEMPLSNFYMDERNITCLNCCIDRQRNNKGNLDPIPNIKKVFLPLDQSVTVPVKTELGTTYQCRFQPFILVLRSGNSANGGHYVVLVRTFENKWASFNSVGAFKVSSTEAAYHQFIKNGLYMPYLLSLRLEEANLEN
ncbi:hypothetical protein CI610_01196 [invertebrate metagenome]|uniref:USP domain-containing protein n=1 Tax=invertebrate metagenome TaxID=1711999 RepID=A0A2H9T9D8_9ZZZZ